jgi:gas vesicle protein
MATKREIKGFLIGTAAGAAIGAVAALLLAPKEGKALRRDIAEGARKTVKAAGDAGEKAGKFAADLFDAAAVWRRKKREGAEKTDAPEAASGTGTADSDDTLREEAV